MKRLKQDKQKEIMDTALQLFLEKGYEKTSIKDITEKMNIAAGLFHYYFDSKEDVLIKCALLNSEILTEELKQRASYLKDLLLRYSIPQKDEEGEISIIDIGLFQKEAAELIVLLLSAFDNVLKVDEDYTRKMKRQ